MLNAIFTFRGEYAFLSNFYASPVKAGTIVFPTVEHAYQACKTKVFAERVRISQLPTPVEAKRQGRLVTIRPDWEEVKIKAMRYLLAQKFQIPALRAKLLATGNKTIYHENYWGDVFWGICKDKGENHLGIILMEIREELRQEGGN